MTYEQKAKILLGTTMKEISKAEVTGSLCLRELQLFSIVTELEHACDTLNLTYAQQKALNSLTAKIQNKFPYICKYRETNFIDKKFITK
jgi:hypothetical protein